MGIANGALDSTPASASGFQVSQILLGSSLHHTFTPQGSSTPQTATLTKPDDISQWGNDLFVGFQNGVGPQGEPSTTGNRASTMVELTLSGQVVNQWDVIGKIDGLTADPGVGVLASVNEDGNSSLFLIRPNAPAGDTITGFTYNEPLPHGGGTDAISIYHGQILISASAPGADGSPVPQASDPAVFSVKLDRSTQVAALTPLFFDESTAIVANAGSAQGSTTQLALTDPDSTSVVPVTSPRFAGDFLVTSQGDLQQIYVSGVGTPHQTQNVLNLTQAVDDTAWPADTTGSLFTTDSTNNAVDVVQGPFDPSTPLVVATPCGNNSAPSTCPAPGYSANYLATLDLASGTVTPIAISGSPYVPQGGLVFVGAHG